jgi:Protein of unknown function (DUF4232)
MVQSATARLTVLMLCVAAPLLAAPLVTASAAASTQPRGQMACHPTWLRTSVALQHTIPRGSGLIVTETNVSSSLCSLTSPLSVQLLGRSGYDVVPRISAPGFATQGWLPSTYQATFTVSVHSAAPCRRLSLTAAIRVTSGAATSVVHLGRPFMVCASRPHPLTVSAVSFPHPPPCRGSALATSVGWPNGAAGTIYYSIRFRNVGTTACTVHGIPNVLPIGADGASAGPQARPEAISGRGSPMVLGVNDGVAAWALFGVVETGNFGPSPCGPAAAAGIRITLPGYAATDLPLPISVCTRLDSTNVTGVAPRWLSL